MVSPPYRSRLPPVMPVVLAIALAACGQHPAASGTPTASALSGLATSTPVSPTSTATPATRDDRLALAASQRPPTLKLERIWSSEGLPTSPQLPIALARDGQGQLIVLDASTHRVLTFDGAGQMLQTWGRAGSDAGHFQWRRPDCEDAMPPSRCPGVGGVAADAAGRVYVADSGNHRIQVFDRQGRWLSGWGREGTGPGEFRLPAGIVVDRQGHVYVSDSSNHRIQKFDRSGHFLGQWGQLGADPGLLTSPGALAIDAQGRVAVVDLGNNRVQQFDAEGRFLRQWATDGRVGAVHYGSAIAVDAHGHLYVTGATSRVLKLSERGQVLASWGSGGPWDISLLRPLGLAVDEDEGIYIADRDAGRLLKVRQLLPILG